MEKIEREGEKEMKTDIDNNTNIEVRGREGKGKQNIVKKGVLEREKK